MVITDPVRPRTLYRRTLHPPCVAFRYENQATCFLTRVPACTRIVSVEKQQPRLFLARQRAPSTSAFLRVAGVHLSL